MSFGKCSEKIIYKIIEKLLTNAGRGCIIKVEIKERATARKELKMKKFEIEKINTTVGAVYIIARYNNDGTLAFVFNREFKTEASARKHLEKNYNYHA